jgi:hypothetical protein
MMGLFIIAGIMVATALLVAYLAIKPRLKRHKLVAVKPKKKRAKRSTKKNKKHVWIKII